ncbi:MAG: prepilin-type N-terminal cleavage/methylation domain-containing protein [Clostridiales Family XIII bacterium]|jgi:prepilin-type N-terminal cleavage/methylation domain-containing protein|nr:prepilin-type N-terminal cleavage/methylation domain-containing protein [Clostridiales Family XIII bacterium]
MNMILKKQLASRRGHTGFTLVEVIVVLVILAILAAIAIPALTGYIDKAEDKKYIAMARDHAIALRTVFNEKYANGDYVDYQDAIVTGSTVYPNRTNKGFSYWFGGSSDVATGASKLIGENYIAASQPGGWSLNPFGPMTSTLLTTDGFAYFYYPTGKVYFQPCIGVTYRYERLAEPIDNQTDLYEKLYENGIYNPDAGYQVYHTTATT